MKNYLEVNALKVVQPLGTFFLISITADKLLDLCFSEPLSYTDNTGNLKGSQRVIDTKRLKEIGAYIDSVEMAFPNSIILSANYNESGNVVKRDSIRWRVEEKENELCKLIIPKKIKLAAIIDGQHRLGAFEYVKNKDRLSEVQLVCSVYFDLPNSYQAFLFATINSNQKKVNRSLALEQFGYNVNKEPEKSWTPEKFAVFLSRKLNTDKECSPFFQHIRVAPLNSSNLFPEPTISSWVVSTSTIVDGITSLISSNAKRDRISMQQRTFLSGRSREMLKDIRDNSPLRNLFLSNYDQDIYNIIIDYFSFVKVLLWHDAHQNSYIKKTVGIQALFDVLKSILKNETVSHGKKIDFEKYLKRASSINFSDKFFQSSGIGRGRIRNSINYLIGLLDKKKIKKVDRPYYELIFKNKDTDIIKEKWIWDEEAESAVIYALQNAIWIYKSNSVCIFLNDDYQESVNLCNYEEFISKLVQIAEIEFAANLPSDHEFADEYQERFDSEDLVLSILVDYEDNLKHIGWIS